MIDFNEELQPIHEGRAFISERLSGTGISREQALLKAVNVIAHEFRVVFQYDLEIGQPVELTEDGLVNWLAKLDTLKSSQIDCVYGLLDHPSETTVALQWKQTPSRRPKKEQIECTIPPDITLNSLLRLFSDFSPDFQASYSYVYNLVLLQLHKRAARKYEQDLAKRPPEEHQRLYKPRPFEGVIDILPPLLLGHEFDCLRVPDGVWWVNYWSPLQVETVGIERIRTANWERLIELSNGGVVLAVTEEPLDVTNSDHMNKLGEIVEQLGLKALQERYRIVR